MTGHAQNQRFYLIDALRGLAALAVVVFHYHHFYLADFADRPNTPDTSAFPWAGQFQYLYDYGHFAVELFWIISGFVFAHVYLQRRATLWQFTIARFARLYPLHFATLVFVAALQISSLQLAGHWQIYGNNDLRHFGLQLVFASNWSTLSRGLSFNGPIWSVSFEMVAYALFFITLIPLRRFGIAAASALAALCWWLALSSDLTLPLMHIGVLTCAGYFFAGCTVYMVFTHVQHRQAIALGMAAVLTLGGVIIDIEHLRITLVATGTILCLATLENRFARVGHRLAPLGDLSYSLYLVHVPLQMCILLVADTMFVGTRGFADAAFVLPLYVIASVFVAHVVYRGFERPIGKTIRRKLRG